MFAVRLGTEALQALPQPEAIASLRGELASRRVLPVDEDEPLFVFEVARNDRLAPEEYQFLALVNAQPELQDKTSAEMQRFFDELFAPVPPDNTQRLTNFVAAALTGERLSPTNYVLHAYRWFDYKTLRPVDKLAVLNLLSRDGRCFLVGSSYAALSLEQRRQIESASRRLQLVVTIGAYVLGWGSMVLLFAPPDARVFALVIGLAVVAFLYLQATAVRGSAAERELSDNLRTTSVAIAAASLGLAVFLRKARQASIVVFVVAAFFLSLLALILYGIAVRPARLVWVNAAIVVLLALAVSCVLAALLLFMRGPEAPRDRPRASSAGKAAAPRVPL
jgi:hypothetical protein